MRASTSLLVLAVIGFLTLIMVIFLHNQERADQMIVEFGAALDKRDARLFQIQERVFALEKERDVERRLRDVEKQLRTFCVGTKLEMCAGLGKIKD